MITSEQISRYRLALGILLKKIEANAFKVLFTDGLIQAVPSKVFRTCGRKNCACMQDKSKRHGPYKVIQAVIEGKRKQIPINDEKIDLWEKAEHYQTQIKRLAEIRKTYNEACDLLSEVIQKRLEDLTDDRSKKNK